MEFLRTSLVVFFCFVASALVAVSASEEAIHQHILQQILNHHDRSAIELYQRYYSDSLDYNLLRKIGLAILERDSCSSNATLKRLALFGANFTEDEEAFSLFYQQLRGVHPELQLYALKQLHQVQDATTESFLRKAMSSPYLLIQLEAAHILAQGHYCCALSQIESLMQRCPESLWFVFPEMLAELESADSNLLLRRLLIHPNAAVRQATVQSIVKQRLNQFTPDIKRLASQLGHAQQETCSWALGELQDQSSIPILHRLAQSSVPETRIAACLALARLGQKDFLSQVFSYAKSHNLFAIQALTKTDHPDQFLLDVHKNGNAVLRLNCATTLLALKDRRAPEMMLEFLTTSPLQQIPRQVFSPGQTLFAYKLSPLFGSTPAEEEALAESALQLREKWLHLCYLCTEEPFLALAEKLVQKRQNDLMPQLFRILQQSPSEKSLALLHQFSQTLGYPLVRLYAQAALLKKGELANKEPLKEWIIEQSKEDLFLFRSQPLQMEYHTDAIDLKLKETSQLFLEILEALCSENDESHLFFVLESLKTSHPHLHPLFASLLVRLTQ